MKKIGIFCVGTGGHVLPAKNLILQLNEEGINLENFFVITDERGSQYLKSLDVKIYIQNIYRSKIGFIGYILNIHRLLNTILKTRSIIKKEKTKIIFSTGSYVAPIASLLSFALGIKYFGQEQNIYAGLGNKISALFPGIIFTSYPETKNLLKNKTIFVGPVINKDIVKDNKLNKKNLTIGVQGGSQGSEQINTYINKFFNRNNINNVKVVHITGKNRLNKKLDINNYEQYDFIENMNDYYSKINFQISRSGGGALEAAYLGIPQILIPFKHGTTSSHQHLNAKYLENIGVAIIADSYIEFEKILLDVLNNYKKKKKEIFKDVDVQIGNTNISKYLKEAFNE
ncbi:MAG: UDP-N-acetylglucosamine--N-acetylmuramyl-(pentapeptide) pyrophosphoryl-undecaprenol N-acetylglucosamine transferase [Candidatus Actinomarina sp.]